MNSITGCRSALKNLEVAVSIPRGRAAMTEMSQPMNTRFVLIQVYLRSIPSFRSLFSASATLPGEGRKTLFTLKTFVAVNHIRRITANEINDVDLYDFLSVTL